MAKNQLWNDDDWLLLLQLYLRKPVGVKPMYNRDLVNLSLELHIAPQQLHQRLKDIDNLETPRIERIWREYGENPQRCVRLLGFNSAGDFFEGVAIEETFEGDFRPLAEDSRLMPFMLVMILDLYFRLTPATMVKETPEVRDLASLMKIPTTLIVEVLQIFQHLDPYLRHKGEPVNVLLQPCRQIWERYGNIDTDQLAEYAEQLSAYFK